MPRIRFVFDLARHLQFLVTADRTAGSIVARKYRVPFALFVSAEALGHGFGVVIGG